MLAIVAVFGLSLTSCKDDESTLSRAVLASLDVMYFDAVPDPNDDPQIITITSDADWVVEAPEWVFVTPMSGHAGQTDVTINVADNFRDGDIDNPRKATVIFKGRNLWSQAAVVIRQDGDKFRDPTDYSIDDMEAAADETVVRLPNMIVTAVGPEGFICTDGDQYAFITEPAIAVEVGKKVSIVGEKWTNSMKFAYVKGERMTDEGTAAVPAQTPVDITATLDKTNGKKYQYVTFEGDYNGTAVTVGENACKAYFINANEKLALNSLAGHNIKVTGYYSGQAAPVVNIIPCEVVDLGLNEVIYFYDDFEWMDPWSTAANAHDYVKESETLAAESKNIAQVANGKKLIDELYDRGYDFVKATGNRPKKQYDDRPFETRIYLQKNYLKFSLTGIEAGIILPALKDVPAGEKLELLFDWAPMRQGNPGAENRAYDDIHLVVIIANGGTETQIEVPAHTLVKGGSHEWMHAAIDLSNFSINENTKITLRARDEQWPNYKLPEDDPNDKGECAVNRWFFDNVKIRQKK